jgi:hypothetical protein
MREASQNELSEGLHYIRIHPKTGKRIPGRYIWTPLPGYEFPSDQELVYTPDATENVPPVDPISNYENRTLEVEMRTLEAVEQPEARTRRRRDPNYPSLAQVAKRFTRSCVCGREYQNDCAHFLSNAYILANIGYGELRDRGSTPYITARCSQYRPIRAFDMLEYFKRTHLSGFRRGRPKRNTGYWAIYQERPGAKHVLILDTRTGKPYGTGDYDDWPVQYCYKI